MGTYFIIGDGVPDGEYKTSYPENFYQRVRLALAKFFLSVGRRLLLNNTSLSITTRSGVSQ